ncbi:hypothetical protein CBS101457_001014 [Exobasidium rhododendri]|nr:hypothetical protein CBS101457_001014 [Exobasidium rhododendri]
MSEKLQQWSGVGLLLVDIQNDFIDGSLAVREAKTILPAVMRLINECPFQAIFSSQDYHPPAHVSFASRHKAEPFQLKPLPHPIAFKAAAGEKIDQMMWPDHCIQGTRGAEFQSEIAEALKAKEVKGGQTFVIQKGRDVNIDGYSAFSSNNYLGFTELPRLLFSQHPPIHTLVIVGLATDYCVMSSAIDSIKFQLRTIVVQEGTRGVDEDTVRNSCSEMKSWGVEFVPSDADLLKLLS